MASGRNGIEALLIAGPTASGKSALALSLAVRLNGVVINADSMQVYRDLRILTARPAPGDEETAPHRLYGFVDAAANYSVGRWLADAAIQLAEARRAGRVPIFVGGTGLYFKALVRGLSDMPAVEPELRDRLRRDAERVDAATLHARLASFDPATAARLRPSDRQRVLRAVEIFAATGLPLASWQAVRQPPLLSDASWRGWFLAPDRDALRARIDRRFEEMIAQGALEEVSRLAERGLDPGLPALRAHGVPGLLAHVQGTASLEDAVRRGKSDTRRYVKRQFTFARHQLPEFTQLAPSGAEAEILRAMEADV